MTLAYYTPKQPQQLSKLYGWQSQTKLDAQSQSRRLAARFGQAAWQLALRFGNRTTIHGLDRLLATRASRWERIIWLCIFIAAFLGAVYVCLIISKRYNEGRFQTVVDSTRFPVYRIPFPVITICNENRLNWQRLPEAQRLYMGNVSDTSLLSLFERIVSSYDDMSFGNFEAFGRFRNEPLAQLGHINFSLVLELMTWRCNELLTDCIWRHSEQNCCEIFSKRHSKQGLCWAFNTLETEEGRRMQLLDPLWPWRAGNAGPESALTLRVLINPEKHWPGGKNEKGINVMITEPFVWHKDPFFVPANTQTMVEMEPIIYFYDNNTRIVSSDQRECVFLDEHNSLDFKSLHGYIYMIENCQSECHQEYLVRYCNCTMDLLFPPGQYRSCRAPDLPCLADHNELLRYSHQPGEERYVRNQFAGMICKCFRNCYSLNYISDVRPSFLPPDVYGNLSYVDLDIHFRFETLMVYRTSLVFGWVDLMVSFGGIAGLFLGCSLISGMELAYFLCIEVPAFTLQGLRQQWQARRQGKTGISPTPTLNIRHNLPSQLEHYLMQMKHTQKPGTYHLQKWQRQTFAHRQPVISK